MSRSGYTEDYDDLWQLICWRGAVASAIRGKRGQAFLREMLFALDDLPEKKLIANDLKQPTGEVCAIGAVGQVRGVDMGNVDPEDFERIARTFGISEALAREIMFENDECGFRDSPYRRFERMRAWIVRNIKGDLPAIAKAAGETK